MNEAAMSAARKAKTTVGWEEIDSAVDRVMVGLEKKSGNPIKQQALVAYHEAGHAVAGVAIIPRRNGAGGLTFFALQDRQTSRRYRGIGDHLDFGLAFAKAHGAADAAVPKEGQGGTPSSERS
jgi:ATP-dependent Zn protease